MNRKQIVEALLDGRRIEEIYNLSSSGKTEEEAVCFLEQIKILKSAPRELLLALKEEV